MRGRILLGVALALALCAGGPVNAQAAQPPTARAADAGFGSVLLSGMRCRLRAEQSFETDRRFSYRGRLTLQYRERGARRWRTLVVKRTRARVSPTARRRGSGRVQLIVALTKQPVRGLIARRARFRAITVHRSRIDGRTAQRESYLNTLRLKQCELGIPGRQIAGPRPGVPLLVGRGAAPGGGEYQLLASTFGRSALCVSIVTVKTSGGGCGFAPRERALGSGTFYDACKATYAHGLVSRKVARVLVRLGDGRVVQPALLDAPARLKRFKVRFFVLPVKGPVEVKVVRALGRDGRTLAVDRTPKWPAVPPGAPLPPPQGCASQL